MTGRESLQGGVWPDRRPCRPAKAAIPEHSLLSYSLGSPAARGGREGDWPNSLQAINL